MDTKTKLDEAAAGPDLEQQPLLPTPPLPDTTADHKLTVGSPECEMARERAVVASPGTSPATVRTLALVTATAGLGFAVDLAARREYATLVAFAASFMIFCASSSLFAWCQGRGQPEPPPRAWPGTAVTRVMFWSFVMAFVVSMTCWVSDRPRVPRAAGAALSVLGVVVCWLCMAEIAPFLARVTAQIAWGSCVREKRREQGVATTNSEPQKRTRAKC